MKRRLTIWKIKQATNNDRKKRITYSFWPFLIPPKNQNMGFCSLPIPTGWVQRLNERLRDASSSGKEQSGSGQSGSDEERKAVIQENDVQSGQSGSDLDRKAVVQDEHDVQSGQSGSDVEMRAVVESVVEPDQKPTELGAPVPPGRVWKDPDPCLFHSYAGGCAKGQLCEFSHSLHADRVSAPEAKQRRGHARNRIKRRVSQYLATQDPRLNVSDVFSFFSRIMRLSTKNGWVVKRR